MCCPLYPNYGTSENSVPDSKRTFRVDFIPRCMRFRLSLAHENVGISRRFFTNRYFFQLMLGRFPGVFWASTNAENPRCRFSRRIRGIGDRLIADPHFGCPKHPQSSRCSILPHSREERQDAASTPSCEVNDSIYRVFAVLSEVVIRQRLAVLGRDFLYLKFRKLHVFLVHRATRTPRWLAESRCGILPHP
jgi:hypothetical protein